MSFILDALKKLEQKNQQGSVPDLMTVHAPVQRGPKKRQVWPYLLLTALLLNAGILTAWLRPWETGEQNAVAQATADIEQQNKSAAASSDRKDTVTGKQVSATSGVKDGTVNTETRTDSRESATKPDTVVAETRTDTSGKVSRKASLPDKDNNKTEAAQEKTVPEEQALTDSAIASLALNPSARELKILRNQIKEERTSVNAYSPEAYRPVDNNEAEPEQTVLEFEKLPEEIKKELPDISISGHIYSNNPVSRIVNINGRIIREGEDVTTGLKVEEITVSGVIFSYRELRFRKRAF